MLDNIEANAPADMFASVAPKAFVMSGNVMGARVIRQPWRSEAADATLASTGFPLSLIPAGCPVVRLHTGSEQGCSHKGQQP